MEEEIIMNHFMQTQQLSSMSSDIARELQSILACSVVTSIFPITNTMEFYIFISSNGLLSENEYRIVIVNLIEHITDLDIYVNYLMACLNAQIFVQGNINLMSKVVYNTSITNGYESLPTKFSTAEDMTYQEGKYLFYINEDISMKASLEDEIFIIQDRGYGTTIIDLNRNHYSIKEVA